jgi:hypothetical protein
VYHGRIVGQVNGIGLTRVRAAPGIGSINDKTVKSIFSHGGPDHGVSPLVFLLREYREIVICYGHVSPSFRPECLEPFAMELVPFFRRECIPVFSNITNL